MRGSAETAQLSKHLATIDRNAPVVFDRQAAVLPAAEKFVPAFRRLGFRSLLERLDVEQAMQEPAPEEQESWGEEEPLDTAEAIASFIDRKVSAFALHRQADALTIADSDGRRARIALQGDLLSPGLDEQTAVSYTHLRAHET